MRGLPDSYQKPVISALPDVRLSEPVTFLPIIIVAVDVAVLIVDGVTFSRARTRATNSRMLRGPALKILAPAPA